VGAARSLSPDASRARRDQRSQARRLLQRSGRLGELELKTAKGKLTLPDNWLAAAEQIGFVELPVSASDVRMGAHLPWHHSNPFGRLLVAQAISHGLHLATRDPVFAAYEVSVLAV
jgi:PIN domain nuclease of toxin-antitoxin system